MPSSLRRTLPRWRDLASLEIGRLVRNHLLAFGGPANAGPDEVVRSSGSFGMGTETDDPAGTERTDRARHCGRANHGLGSCAAAFANPGGILRQFFVSGQAGVVAGGKQGPLTVINPDAVAFVLQAAARGGSFITTWPVPRAQCCRSTTRAFSRPSDQE